MGEIPNAHPERRRILGATLSIPRGSAKLRQATGPQATDLKRLVKPGGQFSTAGGPQTFFASPPTAYACRARDRPRAVSNGYFLPPAAGGAEVRSRPDGRISSSTHRRSRH